MCALKWASAEGVGAESAPAEGEEDGSAADAETEGEGGAAPTMNVIVPASAPAVPPETGAS